MEKVLPLAAAALVCGLGSVASAAMLYNETFSKDGTVADYTGPEKVFSANDTLAGMPVSGGKATFGWATGGTTTSGYTTTTFGADEGLISVTVDVTPVSYGSGRFYLTIGNDPWWNQFDPTGRCFGVITIDSSGIAAGHGAAVPFTMNQSHTVSIFLNASGGSQSYVSPDGTTSYTLNAGSYSVFDGTNLVAGNVERSEDRTLATLSLFPNRNWNGAESLTDIDNLVIRNDLNMYPVPEPASLGLLAAGGLLSLRRRRPVESAPRP